MSSPLTPTARVILGLLALAPRTGYDVKQVTDRSTRFFWGASYGQIYPELRRLETAGLVASSEEPRGRLRRRLYRITEAGRTVLDDWLSAPEEQTDVRDEGLLKLFFGELMPREQLLELVRRRIAHSEESVALFGAIGDELGRLDEPSDSVLRYGIELMTWDAAWWRELERRLS